MRMTAEEWDKYFDMELEEDEQSSGVNEYEVVYMSEMDSYIQEEGLEELRDFLVRETD